MLPQRWVESLAGLFVLLALFAFFILAFKVSGLTSLFPEKTYQVTAIFEDIGGLKLRSPVKIGGVQVGEVANIALDKQTFQAIVTLKIKSAYQDIPDDSSASILTAGLLGDNYIALTPMYSNSFLKEGSKINMTHSAMVLEKLIGQFIYKLGNSQNDKGDNTHEN